MEDLNLKHSSGNEGSSAGHRTMIDVLDLQLNVRQVRIYDRTPTGAQVAEAAGFSAGEPATVLQFLDSAELEDVRPTENVDLTLGKRFIVVLSDRSCRITMNGRRFDWPASSIIGHVLRALGRIPEEKLIYQERQDEPDREVSDSDCVELSASGVEQFCSRDAEWFLDVQGHRIKSDGPTIVVRLAMTKAGFDPTQRWHIYLKVAGQPKQQVELDTVVDLRTPGIERLRLTPKNVNNGEAALIARRDFAMLEADEAFLNRRFPEWEAVLEDGRRWLVIPSYPVPMEYRIAEAVLALEIPPPYPSAQVDMFYIAPPLTLPGGGEPPATGARQSIGGTSFQRWSRHRGNEYPWNPALDNIVTHLALVESALAKEVSL